MKDKPKNGKILDTLGKNKYVLIVVLTGIFLILLPTGGLGGGRGEAESPAAAPAMAENSSFSLEEHERRISEALSQIDGAGEVTVVLTLQSSGERVLATDTRSSNRAARGDAGDVTTEMTETAVIVSAGSQHQSPVSLMYIYPEYLGALVVAQGADSAAVRLELLQAVAGLTGLSTDRITVTRMKN